MQTLKIFFIVCFTVVFTSICAQDTTQLYELQPQVAKVIEDAKNAETDSLKKMLMDRAAFDFIGLLYFEGSFGYNFYMLPSFSSVYSDDGKLRFITWALPLNDGSHCYYGFCLYRDSSTSSTVVTQLVDMSDITQNPQTADMQAKNWYGAVYYELRQVGGKKSNIYAAAGWDGGDLFLNRKVLEQIRINQEGEPIFGGVFKNEEADGLKRLVFEFTKKAGMTLRYDTKLKMFVGDHLAAPPQFRGNKRFYGPDMTFDGFVFDRDRWFYEPDLDVKNK